MYREIFSSTIIGAYDRIVERFFSFFFLFDENVRELHGEISVFHGDRRERTRNEEIPSSNG